jgi:hypothetical protein
MAELLSCLPAHYEYFEVECDSSNKKSYKPTILALSREKLLYYTHNKAAKDSPHSYAQLILSIPLAHVKNVAISTKPNYSLIVSYLPSNMCTYADMLHLQHKVNIIILRDLLVLLLQSYRTNNIGMLQGILPNYTTPILFQCKAKLKSLMSLADRYLVVSQYRLLIYRAKPLSGPVNEENNPNVPLTVLNLFDAHLHEPIYPNATILTINRLDFELESSDHRDILYEKLNVQITLSREIQLDQIIIAGSIKPKSPAAAPTAATMPPSESTLLPPNQSHSTASRTNKPTQEPTNIDSMEDDSENEVNENTGEFSGEEEGNSNAESDSDAEENEAALSVEQELENYDLQLLANADELQLDILVILENSFQPFCYLPVYQAELETLKLNMIRERLLRDYNGLILPQKFAFLLQNRVIKPETEHTISLQYIQDNSQMALTIRNLDPAGAKKGIFSK